MSILTKWQRMYKQTDSHSDHLLNPFFLLFSQCCGNGKFCDSVVIRGCTWYKCISGKYIYTAQNI